MSGSTWFKDHLNGISEGFTVSVRFLGEQGVGGGRGKTIEKKGREVEPMCEKNPSGDVAMSWRC